MDGYETDAELIANGKARKALESRYQNHVDTLVEMVVQHLGKDFKYSRNYIDGTLVRLLGEDGLK